MRFSFTLSPGKVPDMNHADAARPLSALSHQLVWTGFRQMVPISVFVLIFGAAFGLAALQAGLSPWDAVAMSTAVFAGAAQFAALNLWGAEIPLLPLAVTVFAINARHLLMGASLYPWLRHVPPTRRYGLMVVASDANWAMAMQALDRGQPGLGVLFGGGLALWAFWVVGTGVGTLLGDALSDPRRWGLDMVMGCFLLAMAVSGPKNWRIAGIWAMATTASLLAFWFLPKNSHVVVGAVAGGLMGAFWPEKQP